jgi:hypothetical protein
VSRSEGHGRWFQQPPYLKTITEPVTVGGARGVRFRVVVEDDRRRTTTYVQEYGEDPPDCVDSRALAWGFL